MYPQYTSQMQMQIAPNAGYFYAPTMIGQQFNPSGQQLFTQQNTVQQPAYIGQRNASLNQQLYPHQYAPPSASQFLSVSQSQIVDPQLQQNMQHAQPVSMIQQVQQQSAPKAKQTSVPPAWSNDNPTSRIEAQRQAENQLFQYFSQYQQEYGINPSSQNTSLSGVVQVNADQVHNDTD
ncbi:MAG: hypothetical protein EZS28_014005 [Streblomastix strix]|uniref:Uncharacterized protein n=1 Tax=Streblomastix strix TaxID=222440 RepID=A0A5J4W6C2_9EUKA|nr:MAG: hypothetical protein EZS28_014005 [Streblomastix strix]